MSTELKPVLTKTEKRTPRDSNPEYNESMVNLTRFWGGSERGQSLQLGFLNEFGDYQIIQIDNENVRLLIKELVESFI